MQILCTQRTKGGPVILTSFTGGPLTLLRITHPRLLTVTATEYIFKVERPQKSLFRALDTLLRVFLGAGFLSIFFFHLFKYLTFKI